MKEKEHLGSEQGFGEIALTSKSDKQALEEGEEIQRHRETITTVQRTGLIILKRERFVKILNKINARLAQERVVHIKKIPIFKELNES